MSESKKRQLVGDGVSNYVTGLFETGRVRLPEEAPWLADDIHGLTTFPRGHHDDQVDATTQALEWIQQYGFEPAIIKYYRTLAVESASKSLGRTS